MGFQEEEMAGQQPDPAFKAFFAGEWKRLMDTVEVPGMKYASWDRKAAYLLWVLGGHYDAETPWHWLDVMRHAVFPDNTAPPQKPNAAWTGWPELKKPAPIVGNGPAQRAQMVDDRWPPVNPSKDAACQPSPGGVPLVFDSAKW